MRKPTFQVKIERTIITTIAVTADTAIEARKTVNEFGPGLAVSHFPMLSETAGLTASRIVGHVKILPKSNK